MIPIIPDKTIYLSGVPVKQVSLTPCAAVENRVSYMSGREVTPKMSTNTQILGLDRKPVPCYAKYIKRLRNVKFFNHV